MIQSDRARPGRRGSWLLVPGQNSEWREVLIEEDILDGWEARRDKRALPVEDTDDYGFEQLNRRVMLERFPWLVVGLAAEQNETANK